MKNRRVKQMICDVEGDEIKTDGETHVSQHLNGWNQRVSKA